MISRIIKIIVAIIFLPIITLGFGFMNSIDMSCEFYKKLFDGKKHK